MAAITAAIAAAATIGSALISSNASHNAVKAASTAATSSNALQRSIYDDTATRADPFIQSGTHANDYIQSLLGLGGDSAAADAAFQRFLGSSGYQFQLGEGQRAITSAAAARGDLHSGATLKALQNRGQQMGASYFQNYLDQVGGVANRGVGAINALTGAGQHYADSVTGTNNALADTQGSAAISQANTLNNALGSLAGQAGNIFGSSYKPKTGGF